MPKAVRLQSQGKRKRLTSISATGRIPGKGRLRKRNVK